MQWMLFSVSTERCGSQSSCLKQRGGKTRRGGEHRGKDDQLSVVILCDLLWFRLLHVQIRHLTSLAQRESFPPNKPLMDWKENIWILKLFPRSLVLWPAVFFFSCFSFVPSQPPNPCNFLLFPTSLILLVSFHPSLSAPLLLIIQFLCFHLSPFLPLLYFALYLFFPPID